MAPLDHGWRWIQILITCFAAFVTSVCFLVLPETYAPALLRKRAKMLSNATGQVYRAPMDAKKPLDFGELMKVSLSRPWQLLFREPIVFILSLYMSIAYGTLYMFFGAFRACAACPARRPDVAQPSYSKKAAAGPPALAALPSLAWPSACSSPCSTSSSTTMRGSSGSLPSWATSRRPKNGFMARYRAESASLSDWPCLRGLAGPTSTGLCRSLRRVSSCVFASNSLTSLTGIFGAGMMVVFVGLTSEFFSCSRSLCANAASRLFDRALSDLFLMSDSIRDRTPTWSSPRLAWQPTVSCGPCSDVSFPVSLRLTRRCRGSQCAVFTTQMYRNLGSKLRTAKDGSS
jgi:hypothetical protein